MVRRPARPPGDGRRSSGDGLTADAEGEVAVEYSAPPPISGYAMHSFTGTWDFISDATAAGSLATRGLVRFGPLQRYTRAVYWSRPVEYAFGGRRFCLPGFTCPALAGDLNSHYYSGEVAEPLTEPSRDLEVFERIVLAPNVCPECRDFPQPVITVPPPCLLPTCPDPPAPFARVADGDLVLGDRISFAARQLMARTDMKWIGAQEPPQLLADDAVRAVVLDSGGRLLALLGFAGDRFDVLAAGPNQPPPPNEPQAAAAASFLGADRTELLRGNAGELITLGSAHADGTRVLRLTRLDLRTMEVVDRELRGPGSGRILAAAAHAVAPRVLVIDEVERGGRAVARLLSIDLDAATSVVLDEVARTRSFEGHSLAALPDGTFGLAASHRGSGRHRLLVLHLAAGRVEVMRWMDGPGELAGPVMGGHLGITFAVRRDGASTWFPIGYEYRELRPRGGEHVGSIF